MRLDLYSRRVVSGALGPHPDEALALSVRKRALRRRKPAPGPIHHSDRGSTCSRRRCLKALTAPGVVRSMSRKADGPDNAVSERAFGTRKEDRRYRPPLTTSEQTRPAVFVYLETCYSPKRRNATPATFEERTRSADSSA